MTKSIFMKKAIFLILPLVLLFSYILLLKKDDDMNKPLVVVLLGPPGAGKGTQAEELSRALHLPHISTGDLFRDNLKQNTPIGQKAKSYISKGNLVPDEVVLEMLFDRIQKPDCKNGYILDGFPRTLAQAEAFSAKSHHADVFPLNLAVDDNILIERISNRLVCEKCQTPYHKISYPPKHDNICDRCQGDLIQRKDDHENIVKERLRVYHKETEPLIAFYEKELGEIATIDSSLSKEQITKLLLKAIQVHRKS